MTVYAASNLDWVAVSADGHGGCGSPHRRPVVDGAPVHPWALTCPACEDHLRTDPLWSSTLAELPETHDEKIAREDFEKRGVTDERALMAMALAKMTGLELPETLAARITGVKPHVPAPTVACPDGHVNPAMAKFCTECGLPMGAVPKVAAEPVVPVAEPEPPGDPAAPDAPDLASLHPATLKKMCRDAGLKDTGTKGDLIKRLQKAQTASV